MTGRTPRIERAAAEKVSSQKVSQLTLSAPIRVSINHTAGKHHHRAAPPPLA